MRITDLLKKESIRIGGSASGKADAIDQMVELMVAGGNIADPEKYKNAVKAREEESTTAIGDGIAIPHAKTDAVKAPGLAAMTLPEGVDYASPDGEKSDLIFLIAAPNTEDNVHLQVLSRLSTLLMDDDFCDALRGAEDADAFLAVIDKAENEKLEAEEKKEEEAKAAAGKIQIVAVTACPTGIAHTYMAAEALEKAAAKLGYTIKVETNGSGGAKNLLTAEDIAGAEGVIIAADKNVEMARFDGKPVYSTSVSAGINKPEELIGKIMNHEAAVYSAGKKAVSDASAPAASAEKESAAHTVYKHLMNGVSHMLPFVVGGGILIAIAFLLDVAHAGEGFYGSGTLLAKFFKQSGDAAFGFMLPILAGFIAMSIADRPGLAVGFVGGAIAKEGFTWSYLADQVNVGVNGAEPVIELVSAGFLGALLAGFAAGYLTKGLEKACDALPDALEGIKPVLIYPLVGILMISLMMTTVNPVMAAINTGITGFLNGMGTSNLVILGAVVGGMMSIDMGGPINKAAYVFGTAAIATGETGKIIMASVMVGGMVPPIVIALSTTFFKNRWTKRDRQAGLVNYIMGLSFISEGAIPYAAADPGRVLPSCILGSAIAGAISAACRCASPAPHGGFWVIAVISNPLMYAAALLIGSAAGALLLSLLKKPVSMDSDVN
ncbi:MAG: fructose-specific PTS transporter subunit EIIC [Bacillota bacterium]|nr:fructose-specific PTS transporter subunit EIIC [Clostridium sp.]MDT3843740.1 fructose-specific PTS transporter subunit EIIC [Bacillota bacterium]